MGRPADHSDRTHARYAPSGAHRWLVCHGSIDASEGVPESRSSYAEEGTECHEAAADILNGESFDKATRGLTEQQVWIVEEYTDYVFDLIDKLHGKFDKVTVLIESEVKSADNPDWAGTADTAIIAGRTLGMIDLKAGFNAVELRTKDGGINPQLGSYGVQVLDTYNLWDDIDTVRLTIVQPRVFTKPQTLIVSVAELNEFRKYVLGEIQYIEDGDKTRVAGPHCKYCPAKGRCPTLRALAIKKAQLIFKNGEPVAPRNYEPEQLIDILNEAETIAAHIEGIRQHVRRELEKGRLKGMGWKLVPKRAVAKWTDEGWEKVKFAFGDYSVDTYYRLTPRTPNQIQRAIKENKMMLDLTGLFVKESSGPTLAREDDPREEMKVDPFADKETEK